MHFGAKILKAISTPAITTTKTAARIKAIHPMLIEASLLPVEEFTVLEEKEPLNGAADFEAVPTEADEADEWEKELELDDGEGGR